MEAKKEKKTSAVTKILLVAGFVVLVLVAISVVQETYRKNQIQKMINDLQAQAEQVGRENSEIKDNVAYLNSQDYQKKQAKEKLNLQEPGEQVVVVNPSVSTSVKTVEVATAPIAPNEPNIPNPQKWWNYFFKY